MWLEAFDTGYKGDGCGKGIGLNTKREFQKLSRCSAVKFKSTVIKSVPRIFTAMLAPVTLIIGHLRDAVTKKGSWPMNNGLPIRCKAFSIFYCVTVKWRGQLIICRCYSGN